jgi:hypothetical protein
MQRIIILALLVTTLVVCGGVKVQAQAVTNGWISVVVDEREKVIVPGSAPQAVFIYEGQIVHQWGASQAEYLKAVPYGLDVEAVFFPNIDAQQQAIEGVYMSMAELSGSLKVLRDSNGNTGVAGVYRCERTMDGRYAVRIPIDRFQNGPQCLRFYALVKDGKRKEYKFLIIKWASRTDTVALASRIEYTTAAWPAGAKRPTWLELAAFMEKAGVGGSGPVYDILLANASVSTPQPQVVEQPAPMPVPMPQVQPVSAPMPQVQPVSAPMPQPQYPQMPPMPQPQYQQFTFRAVTPEEMNAALGQVQGVINSHADSIDSLNQRVGVLEAKAGQGDQRFQALENRPVNVPGRAVNFFFKVNWLTSPVYTLEIRDSKGTRMRTYYGHNGRADILSFVTDPCEGSFYLRVLDVKSQTWGVAMQIKTAELTNGQTVQYYMGGR